MGAISTEAVILDPGATISGYGIVETGANSTEAALFAQRQSRVVT